MLLTSFWTLSHALVVELSTPYLCVSVLVIAFFIESSSCDVQTKQMKKSLAIFSSINIYGKIVLTNWLLGCLDQTANKVGTDKGAEARICTTEKRNLKNK